MVAFPIMLIGPALEAGIAVPPEIINKRGTENWDSEKFPHWTLFCNVQLGASMPTPTAHWENAKIIAKIPNDQIRNVTWKELLNLGIQVGVSQ